MSLTKTDLSAIETIVTKGIKPLREDIENLRDSVAAGFNEMDERFNAIEDRLKTVESDTSRLRGNFLGLKQKVVDNNP